MNKKEIITIKKIIDHAETIVSITAEIADSKTYSKNRLITDAVAFNLLQIGELAHDALSEETVLSLNTIPWKEIYGLRNRIVHGYAGVDFNIIFTTVKEDIPVLIEQLKSVIKN